MHFLFTMLKVVYVLSTPMPEFMENETLEQIRKRCKWENDDYICRRHILNEDASSKKFLVSNFNNYKMVDSRAKESGKGKGKEITGSSSVNMIEDDKNKNNKKEKKRKNDGATCHACKDRCWFDTFHLVQDGFVLHMGDELTKRILGHGKAVDQLEYSRAIGCLMYAMTRRRPYIAYVLGKLSRYTSNLSTHHWHAIIRVFLLGGDAILWASKKQTCISDSTMEAEFVALAAAGKEAECAPTLSKAYCQIYNGKSRHLGVKHTEVWPSHSEAVRVIEKFEEAKKVNPFPELDCKAFLHKSIAKVKKQLKKVKEKNMKLLMKICLNDNNVVNELNVEDREGLCCVLDNQLKLIDEALEAKACGKGKENV
nr:zinc finger, CCHC-type [Tanacetum cinerariifolium]